MAARHESNANNRVGFLQAMEKVRAIAQPEWPPLLLVRQLRAESHAEVRAGNLDQALALFRRIVPTVAGAGDWTTEVRVRNNFADLLWQTGAVDAAADELEHLAEQIRTKPAMPGDMAIVMSNLVGIFAEQGHLDVAVRAAREGWPFMRRSKQPFLEEMVYLFWRCGQLQPAALLLGNSDAEHARSGHERQPNERRLMAAARPALAAALGESGFASLLESGATMQEGELYTLISDAIDALGLGTSPSPSGSAGAA